MENTTRPKATRWLSGIARFVIGSSLVLIGAMIGLSAAITVIGLPIGVAVVGFGLQLLIAPKTA
ncbi:MAG: hypothetical protein M3135_02305 [Actinomycetota bacterium]|nr:hypothetical protein [Actinomycetota bacterium]